AQFRKRPKDYPVCSESHQRSAAVTPIGHEYFKVLIEFSQQAYQGPHRVDVSATGVHTKIDAFRHGGFFENPEQGFFYIGVELGSQPGKKGEAIPIKVEKTNDSPSAAQPFDLLEYLTSIFMRHAAPTVSIPPFLRTSRLSDPSRFWMVNTLGFVKYRAASPTCPSWAGLETLRGFPT
ncbi:MAG: hypothetical protein WCG85_00410, partial [Polyangia bacterium]